MKTNSTPKTTANTELELDAEPEENEGENPIELKIPDAPDTLETPNMARRKKEAAKPMYLIRYE